MGYVAQKAVPFIIAEPVREIMQPTGIALDSPIPIPESGQIPAKRLIKKGWILFVRHRLPGQRKGQYGFQIGSAIELPHVHNQFFGGVYVERMGRVRIPDKLFTDFDSRFGKSLAPYKGQ